MANGKISKFTIDAAAEYACQNRQDRRTEYQGVAAQMPRPHQTKPKRRRCRRHSPTARHGADGRETRNIPDREARGFFCARCRGIGFKRRGLEGKTGGAQNCLNAV
ncbi:hypothetical protein ACFX50_01895 [Neisseria meningitidis]